MGAAPGASSLPHVPVTLKPTTCKAAKEELDASALQVTLQARCQERCITLRFIVLRPSSIRRLTQITWRHTLCNPVVCCHCTLGSPAAYCCVLPSSFPAYGLERRRMSV